MTEEEKDSFEVEDSVEEEETEPAPAAPVVPAAPVSTKSLPEKRYSFAQWAARNGVPERHRGGLKAFVNNVKKHRTLEEWDKCFEGY